jgi:YHS domain-containing protein
MRYLFLGTMLTSAFCVMVLAAQTEPLSAVAAPVPSSQPANKPINKFCPIEPDNEIDPKITVVYQGKVIGLCCNDCIREFNRDPEAYMKKLK